MVVPVYFLDGGGGSVMVGINHVTIMLIHMVVDRLFKFAQMQG